MKVHVVTREESYDDGLEHSVVIGVASTKEVARQLIIDAQNEMIAEMGAELLKEEVVDQDRWKGYHALQCGVDPQHLILIRDGDRTCCYLAELYDFEEPNDHPVGWMTDREYEAVLGSLCPRCRSDNISDIDAMDHQEAAAFQACTCYDCGLSFTDGYYLKTYDPHFCNCSQPEMSTSDDEQYPRCLKCGCTEEPPEAKNE